MGVGTRASPVKFVIFRGKLVSIKALFLFHYFEPLESTEAFYVCLFKVINVMGLSIVSDFFIAIKI